MPRKVEAKVKVTKGELRLSKRAEGSLLDKLIAGTQGKIKVKTPFGEREIHVVKDYKGRVIKQKETGG